MSSRTLQRQLLKQGMSYRQLLDEVRYEMAMQKIAHSNLTIQEISCQLGYSEPAHFTRAFKRWNGKTPAQFRQQRKH